MSLTKAVSALFSYHANEEEAITEQMLRVLLHYFVVDCVLFCRYQDKALTVLAGMGEESISASFNLSDIDKVLPEPLTELSICSVKLEQETLHYVCSPVSAACGFQGALYFLNKDALPEAIRCQQTLSEIEVVTQLFATQVALTETRRLSQKQSESMRSMEKLATIGWWEVDLI
ncbi:MAG: hypothetical protein VYD53_11495, partial [Pseudomonadota bacterium]|nr:hypothetical protein [Pseudomonadota bacterium]